ncbi:sugar O-acetyltransferase [Vibrio quintilis]|uniref:Nodulation protein L n=1 Tax=Vibrio quintilis TaxID=1117707 RepID=A0A1M7YXB0_9VIBR|nr:sugar O-acetyltransferase [Vibrio quintilis]SHO57261.1 Maltose O-acetyltransferase [Vibrio quintilis]
MTTELEKMISGQRFDGNDIHLRQLRGSVTSLLNQLNQTTTDPQRVTILRDLLKELGQESMIRSPFYCEFGQSISVGRHTFINMNATMLDGAPITIGDHVLIGPNVQFYTAGHSLDYRQRRGWETICKPIVIEDDVWVGGNVVINQGVTIGARSVIAANSVVNHDVRPDCLYGGTPARLIRHLNQE